MPPKVRLRDYSKFSVSQFQNHLAQLNWESVEGDDGECYTSEISEIFLSPPDVRNEENSSQAIKELRATYLWMPVCFV